MSTNDSLLNDNYLTTGRALRTILCAQYIRAIIDNTYSILSIDSMLELLSTLRYTVSFHNFKSQTFKLSVSNPKSKYVAYVSILSQI